MTQPGHNTKAALRERAMRVEKERRDRVEDLKEIFSVAIANKELSKLEARAMKLSIRRAFEDDAQRAKRLEIEQLALSFE